MPIHAFVCVYEFCVHVCVYSWAALTNKSFWSTCIVIYLANEIINYHNGMDLGETVEVLGTATCTLYATDVYDVRS